jgi:hypothetical protein
VREMCDSASDTGSTGAKLTKTPRHAGAHVRVAAEDAFGGMVGVHRVLMVISAESLDRHNCWTGSVLSKPAATA